MYKKKGTREASVFSLWQSVNSNLCGLMPLRDQITCFAKRAQRASSLNWDTLGKPQKYSSFSGRTLKK